MYETLSYETMNDMAFSIKDMKVFVTESDISNVANRVQVTQHEAMF